VRPDPLSEAAAGRHVLTRSKAIQALRELDRAGAPVTFAGVAQAAGISRSWLYTQYPAGHQQPDPPPAGKHRKRRPWPCHPRGPAGHRCIAARQARRCPRPEPAARRRERPAPPAARPRTRRPAVRQDAIR